MTAPRDRAAAAAHAPRPALHRDARAGHARPFYWSVRRELWENRWLWVAPAAVAGLVFLGFLVGALADPRRLTEPLGVGPSRAFVARAAHLEGVMAIVVASLAVGAFYCLRALEGERRDRSILFWRSLPVSDTTAVLAKAFVPLVLLPAVTLALAVAAQLLMMLSATAITAAHGIIPGPAWARSPGRLWVVGPYFVAALTLWHAPIYAWMLLVSAWARRAAFLWAFLPPLAVGVAERHGLGTSYVVTFLEHRRIGFADLAFAAPLPGALDGFPRLTPERLLAAPALWLGLAFTAACLTAAVHLRRRRDPA